MKTGQDQYTTWNEHPDQGSQPKILGFLCNWCAYAGADLAGVSRYEYPSSIRILRIMCTGRLDPYLVLEIFREGIDGIFVSGCHLGDCNYHTGNYHARNRVEFARKLLALAGLEAERLHLEWFSANEGERFAATITEFTKQIGRLGPNPIGYDPKLLPRLTAARNAAYDFRLRALVSKQYLLLTSGNEYGEVLDEERDFLPLLDEALRTEFQRQLVMELAKAAPQPVKGLSEASGLPPEIILDHIVDLRRRNLIRLHHTDGPTPYYETVVPIVGGE